LQDEHFINKLKQRLISCKQSMLESNIEGEFCFNLEFCKYKKKFYNYREHLVNLISNLIELKIFESKAFCVTQFPIK
jgi:hypothetical protein